ncbi:MAG: chromate transporter [Ruminococcaceae bacterium]|nr:chromate transporter [Oscillospiraceae bacterium]
MMLLKLFLTFLEIGAVSFGGGYGMISLVREKVLTNGWLTEAEFLNFIAVAESTPGPIAINMATFVGSSQAGILGSLLATIGVVLPAFIIILIISTLVRNFLKYEPVRAFLGGVRPCVVGLIITTALTMLLSNMFQIKLIGDAFNPDFIGIGIFAFLFLFAFVWKKIKKKKPSPIVMILISACLGMIMYPIF